MLNSSGYTVSSYLQQIKNHKRDAHCDRGIGDVERPEVPIPPVEVHEIDNVARSQPIDEVAGGTADDERQAQPCQALFSGQRRTVQDNAPSASVATIESTTVLNGNSAAFINPNAAP